jgi:hypothetical protein
VLIAQIQELKGVNAPELRTQVDLLLYEAFPRRLIFWLCEQRAIVLMHSYSSLVLPSISSASTEPILFAQVPAFDTVHDKLVSFVDGVPSLANSSKIKRRPDAGDISLAQEALCKEIQSSN